MGRLVRFAARYWPEVLIIALGVALRVTFFGNTGTETNYDLDDHIGYIGWFAEHFELAPIDFTRVAYNPPLYYGAMGIARRFGAGDDFLVAVSVVLGSLRLVVLAVGLEWFLREDRVARLVALSLAAVLPAAVHIDGMINNESLHMLLAGLVFLCWRGLSGAGEDRQKRWKYAVACGVLLGAALLTKVSSAVLAVAMAIAAVYELAFYSPRLPALAHREAVLRAGPWVLALSIACLAASPFYIANYTDVGNFTPTAFEGGDRGAVPEKTLKLPVLKRRPAAFYYQPTTAVYSTPHYPAAAGSFFTNLVAATFDDYYLYGFTPRESPRRPRHRCEWSIQAELLAGYSVAAGTWIALVTGLALAIAALKSARRRMTAELAACLAAGGAVLAQLFFAVKYPVDHYGVIKGTYLQFAAPPMFAAFGLAVGWWWRRGILGKVVALAVYAPVLVVAAYAVASRLRLV